jgi:hypothetical protein
MLRDQARSAGADGIVGVHLDHEVSLAKLRVATISRQASWVSPTTVAIGGDMPTTGRDSRSGIVVTIQAVGTAIHRHGRPEAPVPRAVMRMGTSA